MSHISENELKALTVNAMGRGSEAGNEAVMKLGLAANIRNGIPTNNSGFSLGFFQWDYGANPGSAPDLINAYNEWAPRNNKPVISNTRQAVTDLTQTNRNNSWTHDIRRAPLGKNLNEFLQSAEGYQFNFSVQEKHYENTLKPMLERAMQTPAIQNMNEADTKMALAVLSKIKNQTGNDFTVRLSQTLNNPNTSVSELITQAKSAYSRMTYVVTGIEHTVEGAKLFNTLSNDKGLLGEMFQTQMALDPTLVKSGFQTHAEPQVLDAMFRNPAGAQRLIDAVNNGKSYQIDNHSGKIKDEAYTVGVTKDGTLYTVDKNGRGFAQPKGGSWQELNDLKELGITWGNRAVEVPRQHSEAANPEAVKMVEALREKLQADVGKQIEKAGAGQFAEKMVADCAYHCIKNGITADNLGKTFVDTKQNKIFIDSQNGMKFAVVDAFEAVKVDPAERIKEATQAQEEQMQQTMQQAQREKGGPQLS